MEKKLSPADLALLNQKQISIFRKIGILTTFLCTKRNDDCPIVISGDRGNGKSHVMGNLARFHSHYMKLLASIEINMHNWLKEKIVYSKEKNVSSELYSRTKDILGIDEAYFSAFNQKAMHSEVINLAETLNATRSNNNLTLWCFSWPYRATKPILESAKIWIHKYDLDTAFMYIQPRFWKGDDPFYINEINKAKRMNRTKYAMQYVDSFITEFRTIPMPKKLEEEYDRFKKESRLRLAEESQIYKKIEEAEMTNFNEILDKVNAGSLGLSDAELESYFKKKGYSKRGTTNMILKFWEFYDIDKAK